ncbi:hydroxymethylglutaryl-CoA lyase [Mucilaginibacter rubeus]|uniref:Hydroxymethylglutaryl-CoA lyase n=1 Tax=Mucilaginibacter rubeus TaxID=2027860 RepID=A0AAE6JBY0_9SPHI|nr:MULTISPECIES: hydroxymethylglutaryl-CoA lyase [Mucilaginibacter]QEM02889.1 hydroxymethylglutaryl-CoA lyase [Mucilaginibacter rubeus]QEM15508.1 hydroxymethylglutaryl-CoA lyase [Mucilaginibacter gossypii]QTE41761.1 hydroxymethylglutaryl-CoA lyase [Mucilaginibacter rubeus]QTE48365.1 hydroxymethylglutaryl-CoA lyase [Mucilaginibacter rubeus]QTE59752.1 hydroxymethylglutaryl-CoA lyase [Mucilaginibacter rubeus]
MNIKITECPRDAMQGIHGFIPTEVKAEYINLLLQVGFDTIDFGSFVSPKAIPQLQDTAEVLKKLELSNTKSKLLAIIANYRGAEDAVKHGEIAYLGYPFSISETFQLRNTNTTIAQAFENVQRINELCGKNGKQLLVYLSMGFGNPYGDEWNTGIIEHWAEKITAEGIKNIALADTIGIADAAQIGSIYPNLCRLFPDAEFGIHLHSTPDSWQPKITAAYESGCKRFDTALKGYGGCPMAKDDLTGNIATENLISYLKTQSEPTGLNMDKFTEAMDYSGRVFV